MTLEKIYKEFKDAGYDGTYEMFKKDYTEMTSCKEILPEELELISGGKMNEKFTKTAATMLSALTLSTAAMPASSAAEHNDSKSFSSNSVFSFIKKNPGKSLAIALASAGIAVGGGYIIIKGVKYYLNKDNELVPEKNSTSQSQNSTESTNTTKSPESTKSPEKVEESEESKESELLEAAKKDSAISGFIFYKNEDEEFDINKISDSIKRSGLVVNEYNRGNKEIVKSYRGNDIKLIHLLDNGSFNLYPLRENIYNIVRLDPPSDGKLSGDWEKVGKFDGSEWYLNKKEKLIVRCVKSNSNNAFLRGSSVGSDNRNAIYTLAGFIDCYEELYNQYFKDEDSNLGNIFKICRENK